MTYLNDQAVGLVQIDGFALLDGNGNATAISWMPLGTAVNVAYFEGYSTVRDDPKAGLYRQRGDTQPHRWPMDDSARASARNTDRRVRRRRRCARRASTTFSSSIATFASMREPRSR